MYDMDKKTKKRIGSSEISRWERGIRKPTPEMVGAYLALLGVEFDEIALEIVRLLVKDYFSRMEQGYEDEMAKLAGGAIDGSAGDGTEGGTEASNQNG
jgi:transcriptional regulator with XRE-family HTH domain